MGFFPPLLQPFKNAKCILGLLIVNSETQAQGEIFHVPLVSQNQQNYEKPEMITVVNLGPILDYTTSP